ncbi:unnamed protein product [Urochloa decumbens]|uniref:C2H2-type domain-containing protein n=1 Tax=Urochloa decumbens TaxID=240449 RepID=A0ABC9F237_9POAL
MISSDIIMNSRAYQFQLQAAEAAAAVVPPPVVHAADGDEPEEPPTPKSLLLELEAQQGTSDTSPALLPQQGSAVPPMGVVGITEPTKCPECPKWFVSEKAMFGHLRKHPDRGYKGATRPAPAAAAALAREKMLKKPQLMQNEAGVSAMNVMMAAAATAGEKKKPWEEAAAAELSTRWWPITAKRGRAPFAPADDEAGKQKQQASSDADDEEAAMILLGIASSSHSTTSETHQAPVQQQAVHAPDAASGHQMPAVEHQPMLLDDRHVSMDNLTLIEAEQIVQPAGIALELSAESQTPPAPVVKEVTNVEVTTEALLQVVVVPAANKPVVVAPSPGSCSGSGSGAAKQKAKKQRRAGVVYLERRAAAAAFPALPSEGGADGSRPAAVWRMPLPASNKRHVCPTCGKWFSTYQALGGHMASHVKAKAGAASAHEELAAAQARHNIDLAHRSLSGGGGGLVLTTAGAGAGAGVVSGWGQGLHLQDVVHQPPALMGRQGARALHVCAVCHMTFPSGQALGGHKRKHWFPAEKHQAKAAAAPEAEPAVPALEPEPAARDFDLNEMPEEGEGESDQP